MVMKKDKVKKLALSRIEILFNKAVDSPTMANRYAIIMKKLAQKAQMRLPKKISRRICRKCMHFLTPGKNLRVRTDRKNKVIVYTCLDCNSRRRYPYSKKPL